jgi:signal transduction histidine kinase
MHRSADNTDRSGQTRSQPDRADTDRFAFELSAVGRADLDPVSRRFLSVNRKLCELTGYTERELLELCEPELTVHETRENGNRHPDEEKTAADLLSAAARPDTDGAARSGHPERTDVKQYRRKDGGALWVEAHEAQYADNSGKPSAVVLVVVDVTDRVLVERELERTRNQIGIVNRMKNEFLSHVSHELRTPIGGIMGMIEVLMHRLEDRDLRQFLAVIRESSRSLLSIVEDILDLSRIETGRLELRSMEFDLQQELERAVHLFQEYAAKKRLKLELRASPDIPRRVFGDPRRLSQVLRNLIENAVRYTETGTVTVQTRVRGEENGEKILLFSVTDTGPGVAEEDQRYLFTEFGRLRDVYTKRPAEGAGLGLSISRKLVELMGGRIWYQRAEQGGSTFSFTARLKCARGGQAPGKEDEPISNSLAALPPLRILVAEDNLINRLFLGLMLKETGHTIVEVENGAQAVEKVREAFGQGDPFDLILMDVQMPEMNGMEATQQIRAMEGPAALVPIIAITAFAMDEDEEKFMNAGMDGYVTKPVDFEELADTIMRITESDYLSE